MSDPVWYRSLYWRIAFGFVALLASLLVDPGCRVRVAHGRRRPLVARARAARERSRTGRRLGVDSQSSSRIDGIHRRSGSARSYQPFLVVMHDGRPGVEPAGRPAAWFRRSGSVRAQPASGAGATAGTGSRAAAAAAAARRRATRRRVVEDAGGLPRYGRLPRRRRGRAGIRRGARQSSSAGVVMRAARADARVGGGRAAARRIGGDGAVDLRSGAETAANRSRAAASALGEGRTDVRASESGGDEVSTLARTFNRMADDLGARTPGAGRVRSRAPSAARGRLARADDAAGRNPWIHRNARDAGDVARRNRHASAIWPSSRRKRQNSNR